MTALKPLENLRVHGVQHMETYPLNAVCAHPECTERAVDPHHCFPRSQIGNKYWFVVFDDVERRVGGVDLKIPYSATGPWPHVVGLCREHHNAVEAHRAWIKLGKDGVFVWYDRVDANEGDPQNDIAFDGDWFHKVGPLNPQPGSQEGKTKRKKFKGEKRRKRTVVSYRVPDDAEEGGAGILDDLIEQVEAKIYVDATHEARPSYYTLCDALAFTLTNAGPDDFE